MPRKKQQKTPAAAGPSPMLRALLALARIVIFDDEHDAGDAQRRRRELFVEGFRGAYMRSLEWATLRELRDTAASLFTEGLPRSVEGDRQADELADRLVTVVFNLDQLKLRELVPALAQADEANLAAARRSSARPKPGPKKTAAKKPSKGQGKAAPKAKPAKKTATKKPSAKASASGPPPVDPRQLSIDGKAGAAA